MGNEEKECLFSRFESSQQIAVPDSFGKAFQVCGAEELESAPGEVRTNERL